MEIKISETKNIELKQIIDLYRANKWSSADKPKELYNALLNSHSLVSAWNEDHLIGLGNAISDGYLVVYYPHLLIHPEYQGKGIGKMIVDKMQEKYGHFHM
ncbi:GNAT family N-acetyltransferase [Aquimarina atlantica]|uniref:GNAT family N-acetyltransferase n=1 Tax=Aquimarina atlantica TaxID=1317122 RepID=UPI000A657703|nr:GNAT family N-acetyltransferase [Aquimarina atlantica]